MTMPEHINCAEAEARLLDYLKRELTPEVAAEMKVHLEKCRPCFKQARFEENFLLMLETRAGRETCPGKLRERILALLRAEAEQD
jgi:anti-sigma factor (TIGR02949 family)